MIAMCPNCNTEMVESVVTYQNENLISYQCPKCRYFITRYKGHWTELKGKKVLTK